MNPFQLLQILAVVVALICIALVPLALRHDPGLARCVVRMDGVRLARWPNLLTRFGAASLLASFAMLVLACYDLLAGAPY